MAAAPETPSGGEPPRPQRPSRPARPSPTIAVPVAGAPPAFAPIITVRRLSPTDSIAELTGLLHRAYAKQVEMGLQPLAGRQDERTTLKRVFSGECYVAVHHISLPDSQSRQKLVGAILFHEVEEAQGPPCFSRVGVASFSQFAVDPDLQGLGIGLMLLDRVEERAVETGATEMALSMAEPDSDLMRFYIRRDYHLVETWQWPYTNYRSAILSKVLPPRG